MISGPVYVPDPTAGCHSDFSEQETRNESGYLNSWSRQATKQRHFGAKVRPRFTHQKAAKELHGRGTGEQHPETLKSFAVNSQNTPKWQTHEMFLFCAVTREGGIQFLYLSVHQTGRRETRSQGRKRRRCIFKSRHLQK